MKNEKLKEAIGYLIFAVAAAVLCCTVFYGVVIAAAKVVFSVAMLEGGTPC